MQIQICNDVLHNSAVSKAVPWDRLAQQLGVPSSLGKRSRPDAVRENCKMKLCIGWLQKEGVKMEGLWTSGNFLFLLQYPARSL